MVLDELNIALRYDYLPVDGSRGDAAAATRQDLHVVVTGRNAKPELIEAADLVTEMTLVKHHFARRREGPGRHRVLMRALMVQGTGSHVGKSLPRGRTLPLLRTQGPEGRAVQAAEHVE